MRKTFGQGSLGWLVRMNIEVSEFTVGIWVVEYGFGDFLLVGSRVPEGNAGELLGRFRFYRGSGVRTERDVQDGFRVPLNAPTEIIPAARDATRKVVQETGGREWELLRGTGSLDQFVREVATLPFHLRSPEATPGTQ